MERDANCTTSRQARRASSRARLVVSSALLSCAAICSSDSDSFGIESLCLHQHLKFAQLFFRYARALDGFVRHELSIFEPDYPASVLCNILLVRYDHYSLTLFVKVLEDLHYLLAGSRIEVARRL